MLLDLLLDSPQTFWHKWYAGFSVDVNIRGWAASEVCPTDPFDVLHGYQQYKIELPLYHMSASLDPEYLAYVFQGQVSFDFVVKLAWWEEWAYWRIVHTQPICLESTRWWCVVKDIDILYADCPIELGISLVDSIRSLTAILQVVCDMIHVNIHVCCHQKHPVSFFVRDPLVDPNLQSLVPRTSLDFVNDIISHSILSHSTIPW